MKPCLGLLRLDAIYLPIDISNLCFRHATSAPVSSPQELFARLGRPPPPRLPFPLPLPQGLFPRIQGLGGPFPPDASPPGGARGPPQGAPSPFPPGFIHPFSQSFPGRPFPFPGSGLPPHPFLPNFKHERDVDAGKESFYFEHFQTRNYCQCVFAC